MGIKGLSTEAVSTVLYIGNLLKFLSFYRKDTLLVSKNPRHSKIFSRQEDSRNFKREVSNTENQKYTKKDEEYEG